MRVPQRTALRRVLALFRRRHYTYPLRGHTLDFTCAAARGELGLNRRRK